MIAEIFDYIDRFYFRLELSYSMPLTEAVYILCIIALCNRPEKSKYFFLKIFLHFVVFWTVLILVKALFFASPLRIMSLLPLPLLAVYAFFFGNIQRRYRFLYSLYFFVILMFSNSFVKACGAVGCDLIGCEYEEWMANIVLAVGKTILFCGFTAFVYWHPVDRNYNLEHYDFIIIGVILFVTFFANKIVDSIKDFFEGVINPTETEYALFIFFIGLILYLFTFFSYYSGYLRAIKRYKEALAEEKFELLKRRYDAQRDVYDLSKENLEEMRRIRHDIKNQFSYMQLILEQGKYDELKKYFEDLNHTVAFSLSYSDCENHVIRDVLNMGIHKLQGRVKIDYKVAVGENVGIEEVDLTALLINLLDNAVEACERDGIVEGEILFHVRKKEGYLFIVVENPVADSLKTEQFWKEGTAKADKEEHGYGKAIVAAIVQKYEGMIRYTIRDNKFRVEAMLAVK